MNTQTGLLLVFLTLLCGHKLQSQQEFFHELSLEKRLLEEGHWEFTGEVNWKNLYNEPGWRRWGVSFFARRRIESFNLLGGVKGYYTFNKNITNFFELRPWMAVSYNFALGSRVTVRQRLMAEWRLFYEDREAQREDYRRLRYQLGLDIPLSAEEQEASWTLRPIVEWYIIRDPATFERFPNERDFGLTLIRRFKNEKELSFGYRIEEFYNTEEDQGIGHLFTLGYSL